MEDELSDLSQEVGIPLTQHNFDRKQRKTTDNEEEDTDNDFTQWRSTQTNGLGAKRPILRGSSLGSLCSQSARKRSSSPFQRQLIDPFAETQDTDLVESQKALFETPLPAAAPTQSRAKKRISLLLGSSSGSSIPPMPSLEKEKSAPRLKQTDASKKKKKLSSLSQLMLSPPTRQNKPECEILSHRCGLPHRIKVEPNEDSGPSLLGATNFECANNASLARIKREAHSPVAVKQEPAEEGDFRFDSTDSPRELLFKGLKQVEIFQKREVLLLRRQVRTAVIRMTDEFSRRVAALERAVACHNVTQDFERTSGSNGVPTPASRRPAGFFSVSRRESTANIPLSRPRFVSSNKVGKKSIEQVTAELGFSRQLVYELNSEFSNYRVLTAKRAKEIAAKHKKKPEAMQAWFAHRRHTSRISVFPDTNELLYKRCNACDKQLRSVESLITHKDRACRKSWRKARNQVIVDLTGDGIDISDFSSSGTDSSDNSSSTSDSYSDSDSDSDSSSSDSDMDSPSQDEKDSVQRKRRLSNLLAQKRIRKMRDGRPKKRKKR